jgi:D-2-hydroxyacid dehydrogenase (NADP+)
MKRPPPQDTKLVICVWQPFTEWQAKPVLAETLRTRWPEMRVVNVPAFDGLPPEIADTDIFVGPSLRPEQFRAAKKLKWIHATTAGVGQLAYPEIVNSGIPVTNASGVFSVPMAEHTIGLILALARNFPDTVRQQDAKIWSQQLLWDKPQHLTEVNGTTLVIVGYGSIGREIAKRARGLDMRVIGVTRSGKGDLTHVERIVAMERLDEALPEADYLVLSIPETPETRNLMNAERLARLKRGVRIINLGRGSAIDDGALVRALGSGQVGGAALDVAEVEPLPAESALWEAPNLFITPHTSAISSRLWLRETELLMQLVERWFAGRELFNVVDLTQGY